MILQGDGLFTLKRGTLPPGSFSLYLEAMGLLSYDQPFLAQGNFLGTTVLFPTSCPCPFTRMSPNSLDQ